MFKTFPEFSKLTLADKAEYDSHVKDFPAVGDMAFAVLMGWWNPFGHMSVSTLNGNLVVPYWIPGDDRHSGLSIVGTKKIDESICALFDHLRDKGEEPRLVNVPEFVIGNVRYPELFHFKSDRHRDEYVLGVSQYYPIQNMPIHRRRKVNTVLHGTDDDEILVKSMDLEDAEDRKILLDAESQWRDKNINSFGKMESEAVRSSIFNASVWGVENVCLFVRGELYGFCLYITPPDKRYVIVQSIKATNQRALGFELIAYKFAQWFSDRGIMYVNVNSDYGMLPLRMFMLTLGPVNYFRKYTVEPV
jgi:hypothetical protein